MKNKFLIFTLLITLSSPCFADDYTSLLKQNAEIEAKIENLQGKRSQHLNNLLNTIKQNTPLNQQQKVTEKIMKNTLSDTDKTYLTEMNKLLSEQKILNNKLETVELKDLKALNKCYMDNLPKYKAMEAQKDRKIQEIIDKYPGGSTQREQEMKKVLSDFGNKSRKFTAQYRQPVEDKLISNINRTLPDSQKIKKTAGTQLFIQAPDGTMLLNCRHRGMSGDTDVAGGAIAAKRLQKVAGQLGINVDNNIAYTDLKSHEFTMNLNVTNDKAGSQFHHNQIALDARAAETYLSEKMGNNIVGKAEVANNDHLKKANHGLEMNSKDLLKKQNAHEFQAMVKGTLKAENNARLSDEQLNKILKKSGFDRSPEEFRQIIDIVKSNPDMAKAYLDESNIKQFQNACKETFKTTGEITRQKTQADILKASNDATSLEKQAQLLHKQGKTKEAAAIKKQADILRENVFDTKTRLKAQAEVLKINPDIKVDLPSKKIDVLSVKASALGIMNVADMADDLVVSIDESFDKHGEQAGDFVIWGQTMVNFGLKQNMLAGAAQTYKAHYDATGNHLDASVLATGQLLTEGGKTLLIVPKVNDLSTKYAERLHKEMIEEANARADEVEARLIRKIADTYRKYETLSDDLVYNKSYDLEKAAQRDALSKQLWDLSEKAHNGSLKSFKINDFADKITQAMNAKSTENAAIARYQIALDKQYYGNNDNQELQNASENLDLIAQEKHQNKIAEIEEKEAQIKKLIEQEAKRQEIAKFHSDSNIQIAQEDYERKKKNNEILEDLQKQKLAMQKSQASSQSVSLAQRKKSYMKTMAQATAQAASEAQTAMLDTMKKVDAARNPSSSIYNSPSKTYTSSTSQQNTKTYPQSKTSSTINTQELEVKQQAEGKKLAYQLNEIIKSRNNALANLQSYNAEMLKKENAVYKSTHDRLVQEKGSILAIGDIERGICKIEARKASGHLSKPIFVDNSSFNTYHTSYEGGKKYIDLINKLNKEIEIYDKQYGIKYENKTFWYKVSDGGYINIDF